LGFHVLAFVDVRVATFFASPFSFAYHLICTPVYPL